MKIWHFLAIFVLLYKFSDGQLNVTRTKRQIYREDVTHKPKTFRSRAEEKDEADKEIEQTLLQEPDADYNDYGLGSDSPFFEGDLNPQKPSPAYAEPPRNKPQPAYEEPLKQKPALTYQNPSHGGPLPTASINIHRGKGSFITSHYTKPVSSPLPPHTPTLYPEEHRIPKAASILRPKPSHPATYNKPKPAYEEPYHQPNHLEHPNKKKNPIPGEPGVDYPLFNEVPHTSFSCDKVPFRPGMYANPETGCQAYHVCHDDRHGYQGASFLCTNGTIFNQETFSCDWWYKVDCDKATSFYELNTDPNHNPYFQKPYSEEVYENEDQSFHPYNAPSANAHLPYQSQIAPTYREAPEPKAHQGTRRASLTHSQSIDFSGISSKREIGKDVVPPLNSGFNDHFTSSTIFPRPPRVQIHRKNAETKPSSRPSQNPWRRSDETKFTNTFKSHMIPTPNLQELTTYKNTESVANIYENTEPVANIYENTESVALHPEPPTPNPTERYESEAVTTFGEVDYSTINSEPIKEFQTALALKEVGNVRPPTRRNSQRRRYKTGQRRRRPLRQGSSYGNKKLSNTNKRTTSTEISVPVINRKESKHTRTVQSRTTVKDILPKPALSLNTRHQGRFSTSNPRISIPSPNLNLRSKSKFRQSSSPRRNLKRRPTESPFVILNTPLNVEKREEIPVYTPNSPMNPVIGERKENQAYPSNHPTKLGTKERKERPVYTQNTQDNGGIEKKESTVYASNSEKSLDIEGKEEIPVYASNTPETSLDIERREKIPIYASNTPQTHSKGNPGYASNFEISLGVQGREESPIYTSNTQKIRGMKKENPVYASNSNLGIEEREESPIYTSSIQDTHSIGGQKESPVYVSNSEISFKVEGREESPIYASNTPKIRGIEKKEGPVYTSNSKINLGTEGRENIPVHAFNTQKTREIGKEEDPVYASTSETSLDIEGREEIPVYESNTPQTRGIGKKEKPVYAPNSEINIGVKEREESPIYTSNTQKTRGIRKKEKPVYSSNSQINLRIKGRGKSSAASITPMTQGIERRKVLKKSTPNHSTSHRAEMSGKTRKRFQNRRRTSIRRPSHHQMNSFKGNFNKETTKILSANSQLPDSRPSRTNENEEGRPSPKLNQKPKDFQHDLSTKYTETPTTTIAKDEVNFKSSEIIPTSLDSLNDFPTIPAFKDTEEVTTPIIKDVSRPVLKISKLFKNENESISSSELVFATAKPSTLSRNDEEFKRKISRSEVERESSIKAKISENFKRNKIKRIRILKPNSKRSETRTNVINNERKTPENAFPKRRRTKPKTINEPEEKTTVPKISTTEVSISSRIDDGPDLYFIDEPSHKIMVNQPNSSSLTSKSVQKIKQITSSASINEPNKESFEIEEKFENIKTVVRNFEGKSETSNHGENKKKIVYKRPGATSSTKKLRRNRTRPSKGKILDETDASQSLLTGIRKSGIQTRRVPHKDVSEDAVVDLKWGQRSK